MNVKQLITELQKYDDDYNVALLTGEGELEIVEVELDLESVDDNTIPYVWLRGNDF